MRFIKKFFVEVIISIVLILLLALMLFFRESMIVENIFVSYLASYIFYWIIIFIPKFLDARNYNKLIARKIEFMHGRINKMFKLLLSENTYNFNHSKEEFEKRLKTLNLDSDAGYYFNQVKVTSMTKREAISTHFKEFQKAFYDFLPLLPFTDSYLTKLLNEIDSNPFYLFIPHLTSVQLKIESLEPNVNDLYELYLSNRKLHQCIRLK